MKLTLRKAFLSRLFFEEMILIIFCRYNVTKLKKDREELQSAIRNNNSKINWIKLNNLAYKNRVSKLIYLTIQKLSLQKYIPSNVLSQLKNITISSFSFQALVEKEYEKVIREFYINKINFVVLKSFLVKKFLFKDEAIKKDNDLDLFISSSIDGKNYLEASKSLYKLGYEYYENHINKFSSQDPLTIDSQIIYKKKIHLNANIFFYCVIELHNTVVDTFEFPPYLMPKYKNQIISLILCTDIKILRVNSSKVAILNPTNLFFSLCLHSFFQHNCQGVFSLYEIVLIVKKYRDKLDWNNIIMRLKELELFSEIFWFFCFLDRLFPNVFYGKIKKEIDIFYKDLSIIKKILLITFLSKAIDPTNFSTNRKKESEKMFLWILIGKYNFIKKINYLLQAVYFKLFIL